MKIISIIITLSLSILLYKKAAGTLKVNLINALSFSFYSLLLFQYIGVILVFLGFRNHYLIQKISSDDIINKTYWLMSYCMIALPLFIYVFNSKIYKIKDMKKEYTDNIKKEVELGNEKQQKKIFKVILFCTLICLIAVIYVFYCIGYVPLFKYFEKGFDFAVARISNGRNFAGNVYIKNLIMLTITPVLSYISYIYMKKTKERKWLLLFIFLFILNIFVKTYDFAKAPLIYYICYFFVIDVMIGNTFRFKKTIKYFGVAIFLVILSYYCVLDYKGKIFSIESGPVSRIVISQAGTLILHIDAFPQKINYLKGHSFPPFTKFLFGEGDYNIRSGRELMKVYNESAIENGTAGVMSTMFLGEAYANFGLLGAFISPIIVALIFSSIMCLYLKSKKSSLNIILYLEGIIIFTGVLNSGFVEFFYNVSFLTILIFIFAIKFTLKINFFDNKLKNERKA